MALWHLSSLFWAYADDRTLQRAGVTEPFGYLLKSGFPVADRGRDGPVQARGRSQAPRKRRTEKGINIFRSFPGLGRGVKFPPPAQMTGVFAQPIGAT